MIQHFLGEQMFSCSSQRQIFLCLMWKVHPQSPCKHTDTNAHDKSSILPMHQSSRGILPAVMSPYALEMISSAFILLPLWNLTLLALSFIHELDIWLGSSGVRNLHPMRSLDIFLRTFKLHPARSGGERAVAAWWHDMWQEGQTCDTLNALGPLRVICAPRLSGFKS